MKPRFNWPIWVGFLLGLFAFGSVAFFARYPITRDFPWVNLLLFAVALVLVVIGARRAFTPGRRRVAKIGASVLATLSVCLVVFFCYIAFVMSRELPGSNNAPQIGQKAPDFTLPDTNGQPVALSELLTTPLNGTPPKGVLLVFYRGHW